MREITEKQLVSIRELYKKGLTEIPRLRGLESGLRPARRQASAS